MHLLLGGATSLDEANRKKVDVNVRNQCIKVAILNF